MTDICGILSVVFTVLFVAALRFHALARRDMEWQPCSKTTKEINDTYRVSVWVLAVTGSITAVLASMLLFILNK